MENLRQKSEKSKKEILARIAAAREGRTLSYPEPDWQKNIYKGIEPSLEECFADELKKVSGNCVLCENESDVFDKIKALMAEKGQTRIFCKDVSIAEQLDSHNIAHTNAEADFTDMELGITRCEFLVARTRSVMVSAASPSGRKMNIFPPSHIVLAKKSQIVPYVTDALNGMRQRYDTLPSAITNITGPSRTSDIEKTLVLGAHGPKDIWVFVNLNE
jgi:L-lactate dehydrogenase complex protein LldG